MMFSLDVFGQGYGFWGTLGAFLMHNLLAFMLIALLVFAWKREWIGAIAFGLFGLLYVSRLALQGMRGRFEWYFLSWSMIIAGPAFLVAILFWINWKKRRYAGGSRKNISKIK